MTLNPKVGGRRVAVAQSSARFRCGAAWQAANLWMFHGEVDGRWRLLLTAADDQIVSVRNVSQTRDRALPGDAS